MRLLFLICFGLILAISPGCDAPEKIDEAPKPESETATTEPTSSDAIELTSFLTVDAYDPERDAVADLEMTKTLAAKSNKRILLEVGGKWWGWCPRLDEFVQTNEKVNQLLQENFLVMKVNYGDGNDNEKLLGQYPKIPAYPHLFVLAPNGDFLHSQGTGELEEGKGYNEEVFAKFLNDWKPKPVAE